jgi:signal peptidase I
MRILAVLFNLFLVPGVGHVAIGRWRRGLPWLAAVVVTMPAAFIHPAAVLALVVLPRIGSAIEVSLLEQRSAPTGMQALAVYGGGLFAAAVWFALLQAFLVEAWKIPSGAMIPTLEIGDHLFGSKLAYEIGEPARGDVAIFVNPCEPDKDFVMRVIGLQGDTIEVRCDVLYLNGRAVPAHSLKEDCTYWDRREAGGPWIKETCTSYVETLDGRPYETVHSPARRERDRLRKLVGGERSYEELRGEGDFPEIGRLPQCPERDGGPAPAPLGKLEASPQPGAGACGQQQRYVVPDGHAFVMGDNREESSDSRRWGPVPLDHFKARVFSIWWSSKPEEQGGIAWGRIGPVD